MHASNNRINQEQAIMSDDNIICGLSIDDIIFDSKKLDAVLSMDRYSLEICLIDATACILAGYMDRATIDYDPKVRNYLNFFNPNDLVDFEATTIPRSYNKRTVTVYKGRYVLCKILSIEELILSNLCKNMLKDFKNIDKLILSADMVSIKDLTGEVMKDIDTRHPRIKENFMISLSAFKERYDLVL